MTRFVHSGALFLGSAEASRVFLGFEKTERYLSCGILCGRKDCVSLGGPIWRFSRDDDKVCGVLFALENSDVRRAF